MSELPHNEFTVTLVAAMLQMLNLTSEASKAISCFSTLREILQLSFSIKCIDKFILSSDRILEPSAAWNRYLGPAYRISCNIALSLSYQISTPSSLQERYDCSSTILHQCIKKKISHSVLMLFPWTAQQFCELSAGCKSGSCWDQASQEGQRGKSCTVRHKVLNAKSKLRFRTMSWLTCVRSSLSALFTFGQLLIAPIFVTLFIWLPLCPSSVICPSLLPS